METISKQIYKSIGNPDSITQFSTTSSNFDGTGEEYIDNLTDRKRAIRSQAFAEGLKLTKEDRKDIRELKLLILKERIRLAQENLDFYSSDEYKDLREITKYPLKYYSTVYNIQGCNSKFKVNKCSNSECPQPDETFKTTFLCHTRFCDEPRDIEFKRGRAFLRMFSRFTKKNLSQEKLRGLFRHAQTLDKGKERIDFYKKHLRYQRGYHFEIGSNRLTRAELQKVVSKYVRYMRHKLGYNIYYVKVFDISKKNFKDTGKLWFHFHLFLLPERMKPKLFIEQSHNTIKKVNNNAIFHNEGWRDTLPILSYFSKRVAGQYGHSKNSADDGGEPDYYYLPSIVNMQNYLDIYYRAKVLTYSTPKGYLTENVPSSFPSVCPFCTSSLIFAHYEPIPPKTIKKPPDNQTELQTIPL